VKVTADTNILVRLVLRDDPQQAEIVVARLDTAETIAIPIVALCETVWVLRTAKRCSSKEVAHALRAMLNDPRVLADWPVVDAGLAILDAGGDFADGVIAANGRRLGAERLLTFDRQAAALLATIGEPVELLA
jgi:predicted nucleic-acid-binding protein